MGASKEEVMKMLIEEQNKAIDKAMRIAVEEKTRYYAKRIARTEAARAYYEGMMASAVDDPDIFGFQWVLSTAHVHEKHECLCDEYAEMDVGYGKGIFPKDEVPELPAHPNCMCHLRKIFVWEVHATNGTDELPEQPNNTNRLAGVFTVV